MEVDSVRTKCIFHSLLWELNAIDPEGRRNAEHIAIIVVVDLALADDELDEMISRGLAVVSIGPPLHGCASTGIDDVEVGRLATEHLLDLGHRRIALIGRRSPIS